MFLIVCTGYNGSKYIKKCYDSIIAQTYKNWKAIIVDDGSDITTKKTLVNLKNSDPRVRIFLCDENRGAAYRRYQAINELSSENDEVVIVLLGLDDELVPGALERIKKEYDSGKWMTYGNWIADNGYKLPDGFLNFPDEVHNERSYRKVLYRSTGPNTFKKFLFDKLTEEDFKVNGEWIKATTESNLMFSCLEMCGKHRIGVINDPIVIYNRRSDNTVNRMGREYQNMVYKDVISRTKKELL